MCFDEEINIYLIDTVFTVCIQTDRIEQIVQTQMRLQNAASHQGLHCLPLIQQFLTQNGIVNCTCSNFKTSMVRSVQILRVDTGLLI